MIPAFLQDLEQVFGWLLAASWQASVLAMFILLIQKTLGARLNPRWRYALWLLVLVRLVLPVLPESALSLFQFAPPPPPVLAVSVNKPLFVSVPTLPLSNVPTTIPASTPPSFSFYSLLALAWLAGAMILLILTWRVNRRFARQVAKSPTISDPDLASLFAEAKADLGIHRSIRLIESGQVQSPAIMGLFQPTLLLPADVRAKFDVRELRFIFLHELAHLKRGDVMVQALIALLQILHWFNPVLWFAFRRMRIDREPATDALVLSRTGEEEKEPYGLMLIKLLEHFNQRHSLPTLVGILEDKDQFKRRFSLIAKFTHSAYGWSLLGLVIIGLLAMACLTKGYHFRRPIDPTLPAAIDLKPFYTRTFLPDGSDSLFHGYAGRKTIDGLPFDIDGKIQLFGKENADRNKDYANKVSGIKIGHKFDELHLVHVVEWREYYGCPVVTIRLHYADGASYDFPIRFNFQVNDWSRLFTEDSEIIADPDTKIVWRGAGTAEGTGRLFKSVLRNPFPEKVVESMDLISTRSGCTYVLIAATAAQGDSQREVTPPMPLLPRRHFDGTLNVHVIDGTTGAPIVGAEVYLTMSIGDINLVADNVLTGPDGIAPVKYSRADAKDLCVKVAKAGYLTNEDKWNNGWDAGSIPPEVTFQLVAGRDPILDARRLIGHWKRGPGLAADVDITNSMRLSLEPDMSPPPFPPEADTDDKRNKWFQSWLTTDAGKKFKEARTLGRMLTMKSDGTLVGEAIAPGRYFLTSVYADGDIDPFVRTERHVVIVPPNPGNDPDAPVDLGEIVVSGAGTQVFQAIQKNEVATSSAPEKNPAGLARIALKVVQIDEADYQAHRSDVDSAVQKGDMAPLSGLQSFNLLSEPAVLTKSGEQGVVEAVRVLPYAVAFAKDASGKMRPTDFKKQNLGIRFVLLPTVTGNQINVTGDLNVTSLEGWSQAGDGTYRPSFHVREASVSESFVSGQIKGFQVPGGPQMEPADPTVGFASDKVPDASPNPKVLRRIFFFLYAQAFQGDGRPESGRVESDAGTPAASTPVTSAQGRIEIGLTFTEVNDDDYESHQAEMDAAVEKADIGYFNNRNGVTLVTTPSVSTQSGTKATIEIVREFPYPTSFDNGMSVSNSQGTATSVPPTPREFTIKNVGISAEITPTIDGGNSPDHGKIILNGTFKAVEFEGFTKSNFVGSGLPTFSTRESNFIEALDDRGLKGVWIPGSHLEEETVADKDASGKILSKKKVPMKKRLLLFLSARMVR